MQRVRERHSCPLKPKTVTEIPVTHKQKVMLLMMLVEMLIMMVETHQYFDHWNDSTHDQKNHSQSDTTARTFRDGPVLSTSTKPTNVASLVHRKVMLLGALLV